MPYKPQTFPPPQFKTNILHRPKLLRAQLPLIEVSLQSRSNILHPIPQTGLKILTELFGKVFYFYQNFVFYRNFVIHLLIFVVKREAGGGRRQASRVNPVSTGLGLVGHVLNVVGWRRLMRDCSVQISWFETARLFAVSNLGRYVPVGKAWQLGIVAAMARELGLPVATLTATSLFGGAVGVLVGLLVLLASAGSTIGVSPWLVALPLIGIAVLIGMPTVLQLVPRTMKFVVIRLPQLATVTSRTMWTLVWTAAASWVAWALALYALGLGLLPDPAGSVAAYVTAWVGSFLAGILAFVSPAGIGAREVFMQTVLSRSGLSLGAALLIVAVARIGATLLDVVPAVVVLAVRGRVNRGLRSPSSETNVT